MTTEQIKEKIEKLGWNIEIIYDTDDVEWGEYSIEISGFNLEDNISFSTEDQAYQWINKQFNLDQLLTKEEVKTKIKEIDAYRRLTKQEDIDLIKILGKLNTLVEG